MRINGIAGVLFVAIVALGVYLSASAAGAQVVFWIEPKNGFQPVDAGTFEQIKKLQRSVFVSNLDVANLSVQDFRSENHVYRVLRFCPADEPGECLTSFYRGGFADENLHIATILPGITVSEYESFFFCRDCGIPYVVRFISPAPPLSTFSCSTVAYFTDNAALLNFGASCPN
ncbi:hypothetical protein [Hoeflea poritis]|uniref:Uncharacterized protein n=1 Tax=Hoeflea poritis TaxID=2993659 RepID=A0ABT4VIH9_9HYPH|nr:hypothetical protein [Hoeflea poritis]MDA4843990.1 hypothetical protein [Hoeflea poritis]